MEMQKRNQIKAKHREVFRKRKPQALEKPHPYHIVQKISTIWIVTVQVRLWTLQTHIPYVPSQAPVRNQFHEGFLQLVD